MNRRIVACVVLISIVLPLFSGCVELSSDKKPQQPLVTILHPLEGASVFNLVMIRGTALAVDADDQILYVELRINQGGWVEVEGITQWSYEWNAFKENDGVHVIEARAWDGVQYSDIVSVEVFVAKPKTVDSDAQKWAVFIIASNYPKDNESKLGNGGLYLAEEMAAHFIQYLQYPTTNVFILFDDGWIRDDNGYGPRVITLQERQHQYAITYGAATKDSVVSTLQHVSTESNQYRDSEVFIWVFGHGHGDIENTLTGGKAFTSSWVFLWDGAIRDKELGDVLGPLKSSKVCIIVDACYSGGFADKTFLDFSTLFVLRSGIPRNGRIVISATSKFTPGFASTVYGPIFTILWFEGLRTGDADGFNAGIRDRGRPALFSLFKNGVVSVEEAFYYAHYMLRTQDVLSDFRFMQPQMNDRYPRRGVLLSRREMVLGHS